MRFCCFFILFSLPMISCARVNPEEKSTLFVPKTEVPAVTKTYINPPDLNAYADFTATHDKFTPSKEDLNLAQSLIELRRRDSMNEVKAMLPRVLPLIKASPVFNYYADWVEELNVLAEKKLIFDRLEYCYSKWEEKKSTISFDSHVEMICHNSMKDYLVAKAGAFPPTWSVEKIWAFLKRKSGFYFSLAENVSIVKKAIMALPKDQSIQLATLLTDSILPQDLSPHSSITQLITNLAPMGGATMLELNARKQQRRELSQELTAIYATGGKEVDANYYDGVTQDLIDTTKAHKLTLGEDYISPRLIIFADFLTRNSRQDLARKVLDHVQKNFKISDLDLVDYHFNNMWSFMTLQDYKSVIQYAKDNNLFDNFKSLDSKLQYWIAFAYQSSGDQSSALKYFSELINYNSMTYYSIMALKNIKSLDESLYEKLIAKNFSAKKELLVPIKDWYTIFKGNFLRLACWSKLSAFALITFEFNLLQKMAEEEISKLPKDQEVLARSQIYHGVSVLFNQNKSFLSTFRLMGPAIQQDKVMIDFNFLLTLFPMPYGELIKNNQQDVDYILLYGLVRQESGFDPRAKSAVGATGLTQLMPYTARVIDRKIASDLTNPQNNISIGTRYLKKLLEKYDNNLVYSLAAYNAGDHRVNEWIKTYFKHESILFNVESIPYAETRNYVKLIFRNMFFYKMVEKHDIQDSMQFNQLFDIKLGFNR